MRLQPLPLTGCLTVLLLSSGCGDLLWTHMNRPERDEWQQPKRVIQALNIEPGARVADLGAGGGYFTFHLAEAVGPEGRVYAVDVSESSLAFIDRELKARAISGVELVLARPDDPQLPPAGLDLIFTCNTYHHLSNRVAYLKRLTRYLRPEGRLAVIDFDRRSWLAKLLGHSTSKETLMKEVEAAGYVLVAEFDFLAEQHFEVFKVHSR